MKYYAAIDTNVIVSALLKVNSIPGTVMELVFGGTIIPLFNDRIISEYKDVLSRPKFNFKNDVVNNVINEIERLGIYINAEEIEMYFPDPKDCVFYEVVMEKKKSDSAYLVTGNIKHFPIKPYVVTPRQMIDIVAERSGG